MINTIVVDTSIILAVLLDETSKTDIILKTVGTKLVAPQSVHWEIGNAVSGLFKRKKLSLKQAKSVLRQYHEIPITFVDVELAAAVELAHAHKMYAYDAYLLVCAHASHLPIMTLDAQLSRVAEEEHIRTIRL